MQVLALSIQDYVNPIKYLWQLPILLVFLAGWLVGVGFLLKRGTAKAWPVQGKRKAPKLGKCVVIALAAGAAGIVLGGICFASLSRIGSAVSIDLKPLGAAVAALLVTIGTFAVIYAWTNLPFRTAIKAGWLPSVVMTALCAVLAGGILFPTRTLRINEFRKIECKANVEIIGRFLYDYDRNHLKPPEALKVLLDDKLLSEQRLKCPGIPNKEVGYFYMPVRNVVEGMPTNKIRMCDFYGSHPGYRNVMMANRELRSLAEDQFQDLLRQPENADFAAALKAAEGR